MNFLTIMNFDVYFYDRRSLLSFIDNAEIYFACTSLPLNIVSFYGILNADL